MTRRIIDPSNLQTNVMSEKKDDLFTTLSNAYFVAWDNLTDQISKETSDILCSAITGATMSKRKLYTNNGLGVYELHNALLLNGLDLTPSQSDLASRCLLLKLNPLDEKTRKTDSEMERLFNEALPEILGAIFNTLSKAISLIGQIRPIRLPRMAEPYHEMLTIAVALGITETDFDRIYFDNIKALDKARSNIAVVEAVQEYMNSSFVTGRFVKGKVTDLYIKICANYSGSKRDLPKSASHFSRKLRQESKTFEAVGLNVILDDTFDDGTHLKIIKNK